MEGGLGLPQRCIQNPVKYLRWSVLQKVNNFQQLAIFANLSISLLPKKERILPALIEVFLLESGLKESGKLPNISLWNIYHLEKEALLAF